MLFGNYEQIHDSTYTAAYRYGDLDGKFDSWFSSKGGLFFDKYKNSRNINTLYILYKTHGANSADKTILIGQALRKIILEFSKEDSGYKLYDKYSRCLFDYYNVFDRRISATDKYTLTSETITETWFQKVFGQPTIHQSFSTCNAVEEVNYDELADLKEKTDSEKLISKKYFVAERDVDNFVQTCESNNAKGEKTYLFRYELTDYVASEVTFVKKGFLNMFVEDGTNGYFAQETVDLEFDIIDVEFTKGGQSYYIPCMMKPVDYFPDITPPVYTTEDGGCNSNWLSIVGLILFLLLIVILFPVLKPIFNIIGAVISIPFRLLAALFDNLKKRKAGKKPTVKVDQKPVRDKPKPKQKRK